MSTTKNYGHNSRTSLVGKEYLGQGVFQGLHIKVLAVEQEESETRCEILRISILQHHPSALESCRASLEYHERFNPAYAEELRKSCTEPREETREREWFTNWLRHGLIKEKTP
jgi:hypothetical protein